MQACAPPADGIASLGLPPERERKAREALARQRAKKLALAIDAALRQPGAAEEFEQWKAERERLQAQPAPPECTPRRA